MDSAIVFHGVTCLSTTVKGIKMAGEFSSLIAAMKDFFGLHAGQTNMDFMKEYKSLSDADKIEIMAGLEKNGYIVKKPLG